MKYFWFKKALYRSTCQRNDFDHYAFYFAFDASLSKKGKRKISFTITFELLIYKIFRGKNCWNYMYMDVLNLDNRFNTLLDIDIYTFWQKFLD